MKKGEISVFASVRLLACEIGDRVTKQSLLCDWLGHSRNPLHTPELEMKAEIIEAFIDQVMPVVVDC